MRDAVLSLASRALISRGPTKACNTITVLFANPIGEDYFVSGFNGDSSYQWDDEWDDDAPSDEIDAVYWKSTH